MKKLYFAAALAGAAMLASCGGGKTGVSMGSLSEFDSLSYALGANIGYGMSYEMKDIPFDFKAMDQGIKEGALDKASQPHDESLNMLREYFMSKRATRARAIAEKRAEADSIRLAGGDSTKVEYPAADPEMFESEEERTELSYAFGNDIGYNIAQSGIPVQLVWICEAMQNVRDNNAKMNEDEVNKYLQYYFMVKRPAENAEASKAWLEKIEKKSGVKKTESGLLYKVNKMGDTTVMAKDVRDVVKVHYTGRTREGKVFDTSKFANRTKEQQEMIKKQRPDDYDKDEPVEFPLNRVIPGWTEGMQLVGKGGTITLWIPSDLAYGQRGAGRDIGPNEALEFEVELIDVTPYEEPAPADSTATAETPVVEPAKGFGDRRGGRTGPRNTDPVKGKIPTSRSRRYFFVPSRRPDFPPSGFSADRFRRSDSPIKDNPFSKSEKGLSCRIPIRNRRSRSLIPDPANQPSAPDPGIRRAGHPPPAQAWRHRPAPRRSGACRASGPLPAPAAWAECARPGCRCTSGRCTPAIRCSPRHCRRRPLSAGPPRRVC